MYTAADLRAKLPLLPRENLVSLCQTLIRTPSVNGVPRSSFYDAQQPARPAPAPRPRPRSHRALSAEEEQLTYPGHTRADYLAALEDAHLQLAQAVDATMGEAPSGTMLDEGREGGKDIPFCHHEQRHCSPRLAGAFRASHWMEWRFVLV